MRPETKLFFFETPSNPTLEIVDIKGVCDIAHKAGVRVVVDNAFASPALQRPMEFGADIVMHSSTKYIDGQGRAMGGVILCKEDFLKDHLQIFLRNTGPCISPFNAWLHLKSLETLDLRMREHSRNATKIADFLSGEKNVHRVLYPFRSDHPQHNTGLAKADVGRRRRGHVRSGGRQERRVQGRQGAEARRRVEQSRRRQEPADASGDDDAPAHDARSARSRRA